MRPEQCPKPDLQAHREALIADVQQTPVETTKWFARVEALGQVSKPYRDKSTGCNNCEACRQAQR